MDADSLCIYGAELRRYIEGGGLSDQAMDAMALRDGQDAGHSQEEATAKSSKRSEPRLTANELGQMELLKVIEVIKVLHMELKGEPFDPLKARGKKENALPLIGAIGALLGCTKLPRSKGVTMNRRIKGILKFTDGRPKKAEEGVNIYGELLLHFKENPGRYQPK